MRGVAYAARGTARARASARARRAILGAGCPRVVVVLAVVPLVALAACQSAQRTERTTRAVAEPTTRGAGSGIVGEATYYPCKEELLHKPCAPFHGPIQVRHRGTVVRTFRPDRDGRFRVTLPPGRYILDSGVGCHAIAKG